MGSKMKRKRVTKKKVRGRGFPVPQWQQRWNVMPPELRQALLLGAWYV